MIDVFNFPNNNSNVDIFRNITGTGTTAWQTWVKPKNAKFIQILAIGGGGGGGAGWSSSFNSGGGGGGGGAGGVILGLYPANVLPNILYIQVGAGGVGGKLRSDPGTSGSVTAVSTGPTTDAVLRIIYASVGTFGGGGSGSVGGTAGGPAGTFADTPFSKLGINSYYGGAGGANGGSVIPSDGFSITIGNIVTGGAGGGALNASNTGTNGGSITGAGLVPTIPGSLTIAGFVPDASSGYSSLPSMNSSNRVPMLFTGGAGGGANSSTSTGKGGNGGNGAFGCGGGGGGASNFSTTANGTGGNGGDGLVIITSW